MLFAMYSIIHTPAVKCRLKLTLSMNVQNKKQPIDLTFSGEQLNLVTAHTNYTGLLENITS